MMRHAAIVGLSLVAPIAGSDAHAQASLDTENGRYALAPAATGVMRLDTRTGIAEFCANDGRGWSCQTTPDERAAYDAEIGRLQAENDRLRAALAQRETERGKTDEALPKSDQLAPQADAERKLEIPLPSDRDIERAMNLIERVWKRLVDIAARLRPDSAGKI